MTSTALRASLICAVACLGVHAESFFISNVNIVDVVDGRIVSDGAIVVEDGVIAFAGPAADASPAPDARRIDGRGRWAIPGLWDMHVHLGLAKSNALSVLVANGVTHVRDMGGSWDDIRTMREDIRANRVTGPDIVACGPFLESARWVERAAGFLSEEDLRNRVGIASDDEVPSALDDLVDKGVDFLKLRTVQSKDAYFAIAEGARSRGIQFVGHAPPGAVSLVEAAEAGQASIEHYIDAPGIRNLPDDRSSAFAAFKKHGTHFVPTMVSGHGFRVKPTEEVLAVIDDTSNSLDPRRRYVAAATLDRWRTQLEMKGSERFKWDYVKIHADNLALFGEMHRAGVSLMVGTDLGAPVVFPGFSVHDELATFVNEMGISEMDALRAATLVPARFVGQADRFGAIRAGLEADFVLLDRNPLENLRNVSAISGLMHGGRWFAEDDLSRLLASGEAG